MSSSDALEAAGLAVSALSLLVGTAITVIVYRLGRRLDFRTRMHTWDELHGVIRGFAAEMHDKGLNTDVLLLNADRYEKDYDGSNRFTRHGFVQLGSEYIDVRHNGLLLLAGVVPTWLGPTGRRVLRETDQPAGNVLKVGLVPFEWVEHIAPRGNEYKNAPLVYVHFRGRGHIPYASFTYHETNAVPMGARGRPFYPPISELGVDRPTPLQGWLSFWRQLWSDRTQSRINRRLTRQLHPPR